MKLCKNCGSSFIGQGQNCSKTCANSSRARTNLEKYGTIHAAQSLKVQEKARATCLARYGTEYSQQNQEINEKVKRTNLERYGVESPMQRLEIKEKRKYTNIKKYGVEFYSQTKEFIKSCKQTNLKKYGVEWSQQFAPIKEKKRRTNFEKYKVNDVSQFPLKRVRRYSDTFLSSIKKYREVNDVTDAAVASHFNISHSTASKYLRKVGFTAGSITFPEQQIIDLLKIHFPELNVLVHDRTTLLRENQYPLEIDILIPSLNLGIEVNGSYWHQNDPENYKHNKYILAKEKGIDLLHLCVESKFEENTLNIIKDLIYQSEQFTIKTEKYPVR